MCHELADQLHLAEEVAGLLKRSGALLVLGEKLAYAHALDRVRIRWLDGVGVRPGRPMRAVGRRDAEGG